MGLSWSILSRNALWHSAWTRRLDGGRRTRLQALAGAGADYDTLPGTDAFSRDRRRDGAAFRAPPRRGAEVVATLPTQARASTSAKPTPPEPLQRGRGGEEARKPVRHDHDVLAGLGPARRVEPGGGPPVGVKPAELPAARLLHRRVARDPADFGR